MPVYRIGSMTVLFIHVPKTAGSAVHQHLSGHCSATLANPARFENIEFRPKHPTAKVLQQLYVREMIDHTFMVVRHPVARLVSEYRYQRRYPGPHLTRLRVLGFDAWLRFSLWRARTTPTWRAGHFRPQVSYDCFDCTAHRYEDGLPQMLQSVARLTGVDIPVDIPPKNVSAFRQVHVSRASLDRIAAFYAADYERFGYDLTPPVIKGVTYGG